MIKIVPQLNEVGYDNWLKSLQLVAYSEDRYDKEGEMFDGEQGWQPSDFDVSLVDRTSKRARKMCFTLMYKTCKDLEYYFEGINLGDATAAYNRITRVYNRQTTAGYIASSQAFTGSNMAIEYVDLVQFIALIASRAKRVKSLGGTVSGEEKIAVLLGGLLP